MGLRSSCHGLVNGGSEGSDVAVQGVMFQGLAASRSSHPSGKLGITGENNHGLRHAVHIPFRNEGTSLPIEHHGRNARMTCGHHGHTSHLGLNERHRGALLVPAGPTQGVLHHGPGLLQLGLHCLVATGSEKMDHIPEAKLSRQGLAVL